MKLLKKILMAIGLLLLTVILVWAVLMFWNYPHFVREKETVSMSKEPADGEVRIMSYNVRCLSQLDLGKKNWFYRADLIIDCIGDEAPSVIGFQEATKWQYDYLCDTLTGFDSVITYRDKALTPKDVLFFTGPTFIL